MSLTPPARYVPNLDVMPQTSVAFEAWWTTPVIVDMKQREITRERLILALANKDGGAHVDPELDDIYADLSRNGSMKRTYTSGDGWQPLQGVEHATARQIGHEILKTLDRSYSAPARAPGIAVHGVRVGITRTASWTGEATGRNDPCPCGSGKKYKRCHGA